MCNWFLNKGSTEIKNLFLFREREFQPRFISPSSYEYTLAKKWRDLYVEEEDKKARLDLELRDARYKLEIEMESALQEQEAMKMREGTIKIICKLYYLNYMF